MIAIDNSTLAAVATCDTLAALRYVLGLTAFEDSAPLRAGHAGHEALATWLTGGFNVERALAAFDASYRAWSLEHVPEGDRLGHDNLSRVLRYWLETHPASALPFIVDPAFVEVGFAVPLDPGHVFVGRLDALARDSAGAWWVIEHKTTGRLDERWRRRFRVSSQVTGYVWAAQQHTDKPVVGAFINGIEFAKLPDDPTRKCRTHSVAYRECGAMHARSELLIEHRAPHQLDTWRDTAVALAERFDGLRRGVRSTSDLVQVRMQGQFTGACADCQFAEFCALGRPVEAAKSMLRYEPWSPFDHAFGESSPASDQAGAAAATGMAGPRGPSE